MNLIGFSFQLFEEGINKIAQKVGEEAIETVIEAKDDNDDLFISTEETNQPQALYQIEWRKWAKKLK